ncbi:hypothetical protein BKA64DRAFT_215375 [Cadophora sp. MPI-SDFR-AT-0126]|nr:hypothetical protein BKA64DRAFT_215375 [Leotiomycetes sp. MPI-SDFR-AT-0126]
MYRHLIWSLLLGYGSGGSSASENCCGSCHYPRVLKGSVVQLMESSSCKSSTRNCVTASSLRAQATSSAVNKLMMVLAPEFFPVTMKTGASIFRHSSWEGGKAGDLADHDEESLFQG